MKIKKFKIIYGIFIILVLFRSTVKPILQKANIYEYNEDGKIIHSKTKYYETLNAGYDEIMNYSCNYINVLQYDSSAMNKEEIQNNTKRLIVKW